MIDPAVWPTVSKLLDEWMELPAEARTGWLKQLGSEYHDVLPALEELIAAQNALGLSGFLETLPQFRGPAEPEHTEFADGVSIGPYRLVRELGHGGMGVVWLAERADGTFQRSVALKLLFGPIHARLFGRFARERDVLARLAHPHIARLYDAGVTPQGQPYLALEYVDGETITVYCDSRSMSVRERLSLFLGVLRAVQYAHANLVVHRDLKPSNILVTDEGDARLLDFGIAKLLTDGEAAETELTKIGGRAMTPDYASPEQILGEPVTTASDVYSLGVILYELLTGERPYRLKRATAGGLEDAIASADAVRPSQAAKTEVKASARASTLKRLARQLEGDLDLIVLKALQKQPSQRYASADAFAQDLERYLRAEPVLAQAESVCYRARKFVLRNKLAVGSATAIIAALGLGLGAALWEVRVARTEQRRADLEAATSRAVTDFLQRDLLAQASPNSAGPQERPNANLTVRTALDRAAARIKGRFDRQPAVEASLRQTVAQAYRDLGLYDEAQRQLELAIELRSRVLGKTHRETLSSRYRLAELYGIQGKFAQEESLSSEVLAAQRRALGDRDADVIYTMANFAGAESHLRKLAAAEKRYLQALELSRGVLGGDHPQTLSIMNDLGIHYQRELKYDAAFDMMADTIERQRRVFGPEHPQTMMTTYNLGAISLFYGKYREALPLLLKSRDVCFKNVGEDHPDCARSAAAVGTWYVYLGRYEEAEAIDAGILARLEGPLGKEHPDNLAIVNMLGQSYTNLGKYARAERLLSEALAACQSKPGGNPLAISALTTSLADVYAMSGDETRAVEMYKTALETGHALGESHQIRLDTISHLGQIYLRQRKFQEADELLSKAVELRRPVVAAENVFLADSRRALGQLRLEQQRYAEAESLLRDALAAYEKAGFAAWPRYHCQVLLGAALLGRGQFAEALPLLISGRRGLLERKAAIPSFARPVMNQAEGWIAECERRAPPAPPKKAS